MNLFNIFWNHFKKHMVSFLLFTLVFMGGFIAGFTSRIVDTLTITWIYAHETLTAGLAAILVGFVTTLCILLQIHSDRQSLQRDRKNNLVARKATFALHLADLNQYAKDSVKLAFNMEQKQGKSTLPTVKPLSRGFVEDTSKLISLSEGELQEYLSRLLHIYQVQNSRMKTYLNKYEPNESMSYSNIASKNQEADSRAANNGFLFASCVLLVETTTLWDAIRGQSNWKDTYKRQRNKDLHLHLRGLKIDPSEWPETIKNFEMYFEEAVKNHLILVT